MEDIVKDCGLEELSSSEMLIAGGISIGELKKWARYIAYIIDDIIEYWPDFKKGFEEGWNTF